MTNTNTQPISEEWKKDFRNRWEGANSGSMTIDGIITDIDRILTEVKREAVEVERERVKDWLLKNQSLKTPELGMIVFWGWIWEVVNNSDQSLKAMSELPNNKTER